MEKEIWKDVKGYKDRYQISNFERIKSLQRIVNTGIGDKIRVVKEKIKINNSITNAGYKTILLSKNNKTQPFDIHRLVALTFLGYNNSNLTVNHKDGNKLNNNLNNLEFITQLENQLHARRLKHWGPGIFGEEHYKAKLTTKEVLKIRKLCYSGINKKQIAIKFNVSLACIKDVSSRRSWKHI